MELHLPTLGITLMVVSGMFFVWFAYFGVRHRWSAGAKWWAASAAMTCVAVPLSINAALHGASLQVSGFVVLSYCSYLHWIGLRVHLGLPFPKAEFWPISLLALFPIPVILLFPQLLASKVMVVSTCLSIMYCSWGIGQTLKGVLLTHSPPELRYLQKQSVLEVILAFLGICYLVLVPQAPEGIAWLNPLALLYTVPVSVRYGSYVWMYLRNLERESQQDRQALQASQEELLALIQNLGAGIVVIDDQGRLQMVNQAAQRFFAPLLELKMGGVLPLDEWRIVDAHMTAVSAAQTPFFELGQEQDAVVLGIGVKASAAPTLMWGLFSSFQIQAAGNYPRRRIVSFVDITALRQSQAEQKALQEALSESQRLRALGTLAGGIAHDFNNILTAILGNAQVLQRMVNTGAWRAQDTEAAREQEDCAAAIGMSARRGRELVRQILSFGRQHPLEIQRCRPIDIFNEVLSLLRPQLPVFARLRVDVAPDLPLLKGDPTQLTQAFLNLASNAAQALVDGQGVIEFEVKALPVSHPDVPAEWRAGLNGAASQVLRFCVIDTGMGMLPETQERMFEPFFTTKLNGDGTGLGLAVVHGVVHAHGGAISVQSRPGLGTRFNVFFEAHAGHVSVPEPLAEAPAVPAERALRVLFVDDDSTVGRAAQRVLQLAGHRCEVFSDPVQALQHVQSMPANAFDVVVADYRMPVMDGFEFVRRLRTSHPSTPMLIVSGYLERSFDEQVRELGLLGVWLKSDNVEQLATHLEAALRQAGHLP